MGLPPSEHDPAAVRDLADQILAQARYDRPARVDPGPDHGVDRRPARHARSGASSSGGGGTVLAWVILAAARRRRGLPPGAPRSGVPPRPGRRRTRPEVMVELTRSAEEWRAEAERARGGGRWPRGCAAVTGRSWPTSCDGAPSPSRPAARRASTSGTSPATPARGQRVLRGGHGALRGGVVRRCVDGRAPRRRASRDLEARVLAVRGLDERSSRGAVVGGVRRRRPARRGVCSGAAPDDGPPLDPRSDGPLGTSALVSLLEGLGADVELSVGLPDDGRRRGPPARRSARRGPDRRRAARGCAAAARSWSPTRVHRSCRRCRSPGTRSTRSDVDPRGLHDRGARRCRDASTAARRLATTRARPARRASAAATSRSSWSSTDGTGDVVAVGGAAFATNDRLDEADNAVLAAGLLAPSSGHVGAVRRRRRSRPAAATRRCTSSCPTVSGGPGCSWAWPSSSTPSGGPSASAAPCARRSRWRSPAPSWWRATGRLLERGRAPGAAAEVLRDGLRRDAPRPPRHRRRRPARGARRRSSPSASGVDPDDARTAVGDHAVTTDDELVAVARAVASVHQEVLH